MAIAREEIVPPETCVIAESRFGRYGFETIVFNEGFLLDDRTAAGKIMARLTREGFAVTGRNHLALSGRLLAEEWNYNRRSMFAGDLAIVRFG